MNKSAINPFPEYYTKYIELVKDEELLSAFENSLEVIFSLNLNRLSKVEDKAYSPGKWTVKQILQHIIDWERIFCYRVLLLARRDNTPQPTHDQNLLIENSNAEKRRLETIISELNTVRLSTIQMFRSFDEEVLLTEGKCWKYDISVLAMGFVIIGHQTHHLKIIEEKYYPLVK